MWHVLWPESKEEEVPISYITNGVHVPTWIASEIARLYEKYLGSDWLKRQDDPKLWERIMDIPDEELWATHQLLKRKLKGAMLGCAPVSHPPRISRPNVYCTMCTVGLRTAPSRGG